MGNITAIIRAEKKQVGEGADTVGGLAKVQGKIVSAFFNAVVRV